MESNRERHDIEQPDLSILQADPNGVDIQLSSCSISNNMSTKRNKKKNKVNLLSSNSMKSNRERHDIEQPNLSILQVDPPSFSVSNNMSKKRDKTKNKAHYKLSKKLEISNVRSDIER